MQDLGLNPHRKKSFLEEWFTPYRPQDYRGLIQEYLATHPRVTPSTQEKTDTVAIKKSMVNGAVNGHIAGLAKKHDVNGV